jgi:hypothetical protein
VKKLLYAEWDDDFQILQPGERLGMTFDDKIVCALAM